MYKWLNSSGNEDAKAAQAVMISCSESFTLLYITCVTKFLYLSIVVRSMAHPVTSIYTCTTIIVVDLYVGTKIYNMVFPL